MKPTSRMGCLALLCAALTTTGCQTLGTTSGGTTMGEQPAYGSDQSVRLGTITGIQSVELEGEGQLGVGAVLGAAAGGILGHQIGSGTGQDVATVLGVIGGAMAGNVVQKKYLQKKPGQGITVRLDNGVSVIITQEADPALRIGDKVRIEGAGQQARVRPR